MGRVLTPAGAGGGAGSDECTAMALNVYVGKTAITSDSDDEPIAGTLEFTGDATEAYVLAGKTFYGSDKTKRTGTMTLDRTVV